MQTSNAINFSRIQTRKGKANSVADEKENDQTLEEVLAKSSEDERKFKIFWEGINRGVEASNETSRQYSSVNLNVSKEKTKYKKHVQKWIFNPDHPLKIAWDLILSILVLYSVVAIPYHIGFQIDPNAVELQIDYLITAAFGLDILVNFNTSYMDHNTERYIFKRSKIVSHYLKFWFWADAIATIPFDTMLASFVSSGSLTPIRLIRIMRLVRLVKLYRIIKGDGIQQNAAINPGLLSLMTLIFQLFLVAHILACFWHYIGALDSIRNAYPETWLTFFNFTQDNVRERYVISLYYIVVTMLTVGYGDIRATNQVERIYAIVIMLIGGIVFGALINKVTSLIDKRNPQAKAFKSNMDEFKIFLTTTTLPLPMKRKAKTAYAYYLNKKSAFGESGIFEQLPPALLNALVAELYHDDISRLNIANKYEKSFIVQLVINARPFEVHAGDPILFEGDVCNDIFFVKSGLVSIELYKPVKDNYKASDFLDLNHISHPEVIDPNIIEEDRYRTFQLQDEHNVFGYVKAGGFFGDAEMYKNTTALGLYRAKTHCHLLAVKHSVVKNALQDNEQLSIQFDNEIKLRYNNFLTVLHERKTNSKPVNPPPGEVTDNTAHFLKRTSWMDNLANHTYLQRKLWIDGDVSTIEVSSDASVQVKGADIVKIRVLEAEDSIPEDKEITILAQKRLFHPTGKYKVMWDFFVGLLIIYRVLVVPVEIGFNRPAYNESYIVDSIINVFFFVDIVASFRTAIPSSTHDALVINDRMIAMNYFKTWFLIDVFSTVPFDQIIGLLLNSESANLTFTKLLKVLRLARLLKMARILKLGSYLEVIEDYAGVPPALFQLLALLFQVCFIAHLIACIFWGLSASFPIDTDTTSRWYDVPHPGFVEGKLVGQQLIAQYLVSIYFTFTTMTTVGYGDIFPQNVYERILGIFILLIGMTTFGYTIANVSGAVNSLSSGNSATQDRIFEIIEYLKEKDCPKPLEKKILSHFHKRLDDSTEELKKLTDRLPPILCNEVLAVVNEKRMKNIPIFKYIHSKSVAVYLFQLLQPTFLGAKEFIIEEGRSAHFIHFLVTGEAKAFRRKQSILSQLYAGNHVDDGIPSSKSQRRNSAVRTGKRSSITFNVPEKVISDSPRIKMKTQKVVRMNIEIEDSNMDPISNSTPTPKSTRRSVSASLFGTVEEEKKYDLVSSIDKRDAELDLAFKNDKDDCGPIHQNDIKPFEVDELRKVNSSSNATPTPRHRKSILNWISTSHNNSNLSTGSNKNDIPNPTNAVDGDNESQHSSTTSGASKRKSIFALIGSSQDDHSDPSVDVTKLKTAADYDKEGFKYLGTLMPGDFVGYSSFLHNTSEHVCSVQTTMPSTVFLLSKIEISRLMRIEPSVGIQLQAALTQAIRAQKILFEKAHRKDDRAHFMERARSAFDEKKGGLQEGIGIQRQISRTGLSSSARINYCKPSKSLRGRTFLKKKKSKVDNRFVNISDKRKFYYDSDEDQAYSGAKGKKSFISRIMHRLKRIEFIRHLFAKKNDELQRLQRSCSAADFECYCMKEADEREKAIANRKRRQTFPSRDNVIWKDKVNKDGRI